MPAQTSHAVVPTPHASRYLQQLCKHWAHKAQATFTPAAGRVVFETWQVELAATDETLSVTLTATEDADTGRLRQVVADHLQRFAAKEALVFNWR